MGIKSVLIKAVALFNAFIMLPLSLLTYGLDAAMAGGREEAASSVNIAGFGAIFRSQGITTDGETLYFSSKTTLIRTELDSRTPIAANYSAIPDELSEKYGIAHIGGISFYNGKIYAGMEDSKVWDYPIVGVFDAETLEFESYYILDAELITRGLPWVAVNPDNGFLYCADHSKKPTKLIAYNIANGMEKVGETALAESIPSIQGGEFYRGMLYVATNDETKSVYSVNTSTGACQKLFDRSASAGGEGEGLTIVENGGEATVYAMEMGLIFVNAFVRTYPLSKYIPS